MRNVFQRKRKRVWRFFILTGLVFMVSLFWNNTFTSHTPLRSPIIGSVHFFNLPPDPKPSPKNGSLEQTVAKVMEGTTATYGIVIKNLKTGEAYYSNEHHSFESGSLYKLWVMGAVFDQIKEGNLQKDEVLSQDIPTLNDEFDIDPDVAEQTEGTVTFTVADALNQMITISHNYAALLLTEKIRLSTVAKYLAQNGFTESKVGTNGDDPVTTASDTALFLEKLYNRQLDDPNLSDEMLDLLKAQKLNNKLPRYLPNVTIAHKTGELGEFSHDAGIVYTPQGDYIIVVLSQSDVPSAAEDRIAQLSQAVYIYFEKGGEINE